MWFFSLVLMSSNNSIIVNDSREELREDTHKKSVFLVVAPLRVYPPYTNGLVVHATFFMCVFP